jgi:hypothetical protein
MAFLFFALVERKKEKRLENEVPLCRRQQQHLAFDGVNPVTLEL